MCCHLLSTLFTLFCVYIRNYFAFLISSGLQNNGESPLLVVLWIAGWEKGDDVGSECLCLHTHCKCAGYHLCWVQPALHSLLSAGVRGPPNLGQKVFPCGITGLRPQLWIAVWLRDRLWHVLCHNCPPWAPLTNYKYKSAEGRTKMLIKMGWSHRAVFQVVMQKFEIHSHHFFHFSSQTFFFTF